MSLSSRLGMGRAIFYVAHHIVVQTTLFLVVGLIERQAGASTPRRLGGLPRRSGTRLRVHRSCVESRWNPTFSGLHRQGGALEAGAQDASVLAWLLVGGSVVTSLLTCMWWPSVDTCVLAGPGRRARRSPCPMRLVGPAGRDGHSDDISFDDRRRRPDARRNADSDLLSLPSALHDSRRRAHLRLHRPGSRRGLGYVAIPVGRARVRP